MQEMIDKLSRRGHTNAEAKRVIDAFEKTIHLSDYATVDQAINDLCMVLDRYKELHGEYIKLVMP